MGSTNIESTGEGQNTNFNSKDIKEHTKAGEKKEYFVKFKEQTFGQKFTAWFDKNKKKVFIILGSIAGAVLVLFLALWIISLFNKPAESVVTEPIDLGDEIAEIRVEMENFVADSREGNPYNELDEYYSAIIANESDPMKKFETGMALVMFYINYEAYERAQEAHLAITDLEGVSDDGKIMYFEYGQLLCNYLGDKTGAEYYKSTLRLNFPDYFTVSGGEDYEE